LRRAGLAPGMRVLDVGVGTGLMAREAVKIVGDPTREIGIDPSAGMLSQARLPGTRLLEGSAEALPFANASFDFVAMGYALRFLRERARALGEIHRVLKPGGRLCVLELARPEHAVSRMLLRYHVRIVAPMLARIADGNRESAAQWRGYGCGIARAPTPEQVLALLEGAGFVDVRRHVESPRLAFLGEYHGIKSAGVHDSANARRRT
jgi:demethylmenaquinone methyltransferase/2-methoxy-6-polyprenyl-1,4-benzoquinol methylase